MSRYDLNDEQWAAVTSRSPTLVNASAGSGKTRCLVAKIRHLLDSSESYQSVLAVTFTNRAANEMKERLKKHYPAAAGWQISTIHSMCVRIIREFIHHTPLKSPFSIYDDGDQASVIKTILKARNMKNDPFEVLSEISRAKSEGRDVSVTIAEIYASYQEILVKNNACDFDDLLIYAAKCLEQSDCKNRFTNLWRNILVDEFQDTSTIQYKIIMSIYDPTKTRTMFVVGDYNQSLYSWRGAKPENLQRYIDENSATVCDLTYNYRSCPEVINHANKFLQFGKKMIAKSSTLGSISFSRFRSQEDESEQIADAVQRAGNYPESVILYRTNARSILFERALAKRRIPYKVVGDLPFYRRKVVKNMLAYLKAAANPADMESTVRIVNVPKRGFGETRQEKLLKEGRGYLEQESSESFELRKFLSLLERIKGVPPATAIKRVIDETQYMSELDKISDHTMLESLVNIAQGYSTTEELILASTFLEEDSNNGVKLMTAHASKGLEFDRVFVVGVEEGLWPHTLAGDTKEEERLFYVACTRARKFLNVSYSQSKMMRGNLVQISPSYLFINSCPPRQS